MPKEFSLIIPTYNERENIISLLDQLAPVLKGFDHEILVLDDNSPDGTAALVEEYSKTHPSVKAVLRTKENRGLSISVIDGFKRANGKYLGVMDADLSHDHTILPALIKAVQGSSEMAVASRRVKGGGADHWPWFRQLYSDVATSLARFILGVSVKDPMSGYFVLRREVFDRAKGTMNPTGYKILLELLTRAQVKNVTEIPFIFKDRKQGYSKLTGRVASQYLFMLWDLRSYSRFWFKR